MDHLDHQSVVTIHHDRHVVRIVTIVVAIASHRVVVGRDHVVTSIPDLVPVRHVPKHGV